MISLSLLVYVSVQIIDTVISMFRDVFVDQTVSEILDRQHFVSNILKSFLLPGYIIHHLLCRKVCVHFKTDQP